MATLLFNCPVTGKTINSHLDTDEHSLEGLNTLITVHCPHCDKAHTFQMHEARLRDKRLPG